MRRRYQKGSLKKLDGVWIAQWWEDGYRRKRTLGKVSTVAKAKAQAELDAILAPINSRASAPSPSTTWGDFVRNTYLPYSRKWKLSTRMTNEDRFRVHFTPVYEERPLGGFSREALQDFLDSKAQTGLSYSIVAHPRWDLRQVLRMAVQEGHLLRNPAELLFIPREAQAPRTHRHDPKGGTRMFCSPLTARTARREARNPRRHAVVRKNNIRR
jgi:hypothetical protein